MYTFNSYRTLRITSNNNKKLLTGYKVKTNDDCLQSTQNLGSTTGLIIRMFTRKRVICHISN